MAAAGWSFDPGSFRDRRGRIFYDGERVLRGLDREADAEWSRVSQAPFFARATEAGRIVGSRRVEASDAELERLPGGWVSVLEHERVPFVSYPYEWTFGMLRRAALLHLDLLAEALADGFVIKDGSAYNVQWAGARPVFIDVLSLEQWKTGEPWFGYLQFCQLFLYPLMLTAYKDVDFHSWLRGGLDGISPSDCAALMSLRDRLRPGVLTHVVLQAALQRRGGGERSLRREIREAGFTRQMLSANVDRLRRLVDRLAWKRSSSEWAGYTVTTSYSDDEARLKAEFVKAAVRRRRRGLVWDLGANLGEFSRLAAEGADLVVAMDGDHLAVDRLFADLERAGPGNILPLTVDLAAPSPALGWRHRERKTLAERGRPDLVLCLALLHHLVIGRNIPLGEIVDWLAGLGAELVIEFVERGDPQVDKLLANKDDVYVDYGLEQFEGLLGGAFEIEERLRLPGGHRVLFLARPRAA